MVSREEREHMRQAAEQLRQQKQRQRYERIEARLAEEAAINRAAKDEAAADRELAAFMRELNGMTPAQIKRGAKRLGKKTRLSWGQKRAMKKAMRKKKGK